MHDSSEHIIPMKKNTFLHILKQFLFEVWQLLKEIVQQKKWKFAENWFEFSLWCHQFTTEEPLLSKWFKC